MKKFLKAYRKIALLILGILLVVTPIIFFLRKTNISEAAWYDEAYLYREKLTIGNSGSADSNKKVKFDIDTELLINAGKMQGDCDDIRFTSLGGELLRFYIDSSGGACDTSSTDFYVLMPAISSGNTVLYYYYGNASATNTSEGTQFSESTFSPTSGPAGGGEEKSTGLSYYWKFDDVTGTTAEDSMNQNEDITISGAYWNEKDFCVSGTCLSYNGSSHYSYTASAINLSNTSAITISFWMKWLTNADNDAFAMEFTSNYNNSTGSFMINPNDSSTAGKFVVAIKGNTGYNQAAFERQPEGVWTHYAFVLNKGAAAANEVTPYVNGVPIAYTKPNNMENTNTFANDTLYIMSRAGSSLFGNGFLDELKIYEYARTAAQIQKEYQSYISGLSTTEAIGTSIGAQKKFTESNSSNLSNGLLGYWRMDEGSWTVNCSTATITDYSGHSFAGQACPNSTGPTNNAKGKFGKTAIFDGSNDYISIPHSSKFNVTDYTVSMWVYYGGNGTAGRAYWDLISKNSDGQGFNEPFHLWVNATTKHIGARVGGGAPETEIGLDSGTAINDSRWHHVALTRSGTTISLYLDGAKVSSGTVSGSVVTNSTAITLGYWSAYTNYFNGRIDELRIYKRALSSTELATIINYTPGPAAYWNFNEESGSSVIDRTANGNNASWNGSEPYWTQGKIGNAGNFDSSGDYASVSSSASLSPIYEITISAWVNTSVSGQTQEIVQKSGSFGMKITNTDKVTGYIWGGSESHNSTTTISPNTWYYITMVFNGATHYTYVNGVLEATESNAVNIPVTSNAINISQSGNAFRGKIDDLKIYNYARTNKQIVEDMNGGHPIGGSPIASQVGYWDFDNQTTQIVYDNGYGDNDGTLGASSSSSSDDPTVKTANSGNCKINDCLLFDGTADYVNISDTNDLDLTTGITVSAWIYPTDINDRVIVAKKDDSNYSWELAIANSGSNNRLLGRINDNANVAESANSITVNTWTHVAMTYDQALIKVYINGRLSDTTSYTSAISTNNTAVSVGRRLHTSGAWFQGQIDEVKIYNSALSDEDIKIDMNAGSALTLGGVTGGQVNEGVGGSAPSLLLKLDEKTGSTAYDSSGNNNSLSISGAVWDKGKLGSALYFDSPDYAVISNSSTLDGENLTVSFWMKTTQIAATNGNWWDNTVLIERDQGGGGNAGWAIMLKGDKILVVGVDDELIGTASVNDGKWHHITFVKTTSNKYIYVDGGLDTQEADTGVISNDQDIYLANENGGESGNSVYNGILDNIGIYAFARSQAQIAYDFNRGAPIARYKLDECQGTIAYNSAFNGNGEPAGNNGTINFGDSSGDNDSAGTCGSGTTTEMWNDGTTGKYNASLGFDGTNDYVDIGDIGIFEKNLFSITGWFKTSDSSQFPTIYGEGSSSSGNPVLQLYVEPNTSFFVYIRDDANTTAHITGGSGLADNDWHSFAFVQNSKSNRQLYVDGRLVATNTTTIGTTTVNKSRLGVLERNPGQFNNYFNGLMDDIRIYNYPLIADQVKTIHNNGAIYFGPTEGTP